MSDNKGAGEQIGVVEQNGLGAKNTLGVANETPSTQCDYYGFPLDLTEEDVAVRNACRLKQMRKTAAWSMYSNPANVKPHSKSLKRLTRKGVPPQLRPEIWYHVSGAAKRQALAGKGYYADILRAHEGQVTRNTQVIDLDLPRTFPNNVFINSAEGMQSMRRVLIAFSFHNEQIGYCQALNYIAGMLLLVMHDEEKAFWVLTVLLEDILYRNCHAQDLVGCHVEQRVLKHLLEKKMAKLARYLDELHCDISIIATEWLLTVYIKSLPSETAARILDSVFQEGSKVLFRIALAILKLNEEALLTSAHMGDIVERLQRFTTHLHGRDRLMKVAFNGVGSLGMKKIVHSRSIHQQVVDHELAERAKRMGRPKTEQDSVSIPASSSIQQRAGAQQDTPQMRQMPTGNGWPMGLGTAFTNPLSDAESLP
mmetsp:Transcript_39485/g.75656  ORF Transcript_39485/g.75656 Transcript_39485/m.75656 type:complete len:424 (+) Transcript_39485:265-1536(+)|eukprot:CAMPEP_0114225978 /NCGR_PEP_ID=MMETSP0058-20121206/981_1 /TAXON_ID=36894 /ORGANISM="Pyramimonas parkeae, CCMP726" /LENGTH=423 /DNA_ID=CAMNT_0001336661 /DNA_START=144 /DNA_END=1415 /DNA_ORIENTATION=-